MLLPKIINHLELVSAPSGVTRERVTKFLEALLNFVSFYQVRRVHINTDYGIFSKFLLWKEYGYYCSCHYIVL